MFAVTDHSHCRVWKKKLCRSLVCYTCSVLSVHNIQNLLGFEPDCPDIFTLKFIDATVVAAV